uniref:ATPase cation transporting 13A2 n=1 Tax=Scophthalmus maximus TaxID=52904 RepID=A0A8D3CZN7_SCOMX
MLQKTLLRYYMFEGLRYVWLDRKGAFCRVRCIYGPNLIDVPVKPYFKLLFEEVLNPFYVFQFFSITLWMIDEYYFYAVCILFLSILSISISLYETRKQSITLHNMAQLVTNLCVCSSVEECVSSVELVPGDCLIIPQEGLLLPCDAALLAGECLVNESMLTGESVPVLKTPLPAGEGKYSSETERRHTLFCGTTLIQAKGGGPGGGGAVAVVTSTGFFTAKGNLVSSILYPQPINFRFYQDSIKFLLILGLVAFIGSIYNFVVLFRANVTWGFLVIRCLDIVTIAVPPALPAAITTGTIYAQRRLKSQGVFCISPPRINVSGKVSIFCFDKVRTDPELDAEFGGYKVLAVMRSPTQGNSTSKALAIVQRFPFSSALQRMSVVTVMPGGHAALAFLKGSPEMVASLCRAETVPTQFSSKLHSFSSEGLRVLALAYKPLDKNTDVRTITRDEVEKDMQFLGLLMMKNLVKPESDNVIHMLRLAQLRSVMITGDNILTAVNVAKSCGMVGSDEKVIFVSATPHTAQSVPTLRFTLEDRVTTTAQGSIEICTRVGPAHTPKRCSSGFGYHLAINGKSFAALCDNFPEYLPKVLMRATVFARMTPDQKTQLEGGVSAAEEIILTHNKTPPCVCREGRCSLVTSFGLFRYMALYSLIQFCSVLVLHTVNTTMADLQFLFCDIGLVTLLAIVMGKGGPSDQLQSCRPPASLLALPVLGSLFIHTCMIVLGQLAALFITTSQDWYIPLNSTVFGIANLPNMENTSVFDLSGFQYIIMAVVVTKGYPHKKPLYYNVVFLGLLVTLFSVMTWLVLYPGPIVCRILQLFDISDMNYKMLLVAVAALNFLISVSGCCVGGVPSKKQYKRLHLLLSDSPSWPPLNHTLFPSDQTVIHLS